MTREGLQQQALELAKTNPRILLEWGTGIGKSKAAIDIANYLTEKMYKEEQEPLYILLVVAESAHKDNWKKEFEKWKLITNVITIECYASLKLYTNSFWDLIIFDECHHLGTDLRLDILKELHTTNIIMLSATMPKDILENISNLVGKFVVSSVPISDAIEWGIIPKPTIYLIPLELDNKERSTSFILSQGIPRLRKSITCSTENLYKYIHKPEYSNVNITVPCTPREGYDYLNKQIEFWKSRFQRTRLEYMKNSWLQNCTKRKKLLGETKTQAVKLLLAKLSNKRFICFCNSITQAEDLCTSNAIHSNKLNSSGTIQDFNEGKINSLFAVGMLQEGQNLENIEACIITQLDGKERLFIQKFGRGLRAKKPLQFIFYYKNTRDEEYLNKALEDIPPEFISELNLDTLNKT